jgi:hypothetical protein
MTFRNADLSLGIGPSEMVESGRLEALTGAIAAEARLLGDLIAVMRSQRSCAASEDLQGLDDSVFATHRILVTLGEARRHRRALMRLMGAGDDLPLQHLEDLLGCPVSEGLRAVRGDLLAAAGMLSSEVEMNRKVLRTLLSSDVELILEVLGPGELG